MQQLLTRLAIDKLAKDQFFEVFVFDFAVPPQELEALLGCTTTEPKRRTEEQKLPVLGCSCFRKAGSNHSYVVYDQRVILDPDEWRHRFAPGLCA
ncbi:hypothetical protein [Ktedonobacter robiniae]|uniref:hypothetical protein n=1 Tax=Ktedonobacter robiniae TaxID=2778365 RepID=UPI001916A08E|nr:hypothetical protein [Ktedonobacter robiniae]